MKLLLINPAERRVLRSNLPATIESLRGKNPPIGLLYVAAAARRVEDWEIEFLDAHARDLGPGELIHEIRARKPDLVGITATTFTYLDALDAARAAKQGAPSCRVILGGVQPFLFPAETLAQPTVDLIFAGESEESFPRLLSIWRDEGPAAVARRRVPGVLAQGEAADHFLPAPAIDDLDSVPPPAWDLSPVAAYTSLVTRRRPVTILISSRGCPYRCRYCALSPTGKHWRAHSPARVVQEMRTCRDLGIRYLLFYDETFTVRRARVLEICEGARSAGLDLGWMARATPDTVDGEMLAAMRQAGCDLVTFGVEAASPAVLARLGRRPMIDQTVQAFRAARRAGLRTIAYFMLGNPDETREEMDQSLRLAVRLRPGMIHASLFMPYPGSAIYEESLASGRIGADYWRAFARTPSDDFRPPFGSGRYADEELGALLFSFYRRFSLRPGYLLRRALAVRSLAELRDAARAAWALAVGARRVGGREPAPAAGPGRAAANAKAP